MSESQQKEPSDAGAVAQMYPGGASSAPGTHYRCPTCGESGRAFLRGFAAALASVQRDFDQATIVENIMRGNGITTVDLEEAGVEAFDLDPIRGAL